MKIGIYAGSFNPVHLAHVKSAGHLLESGILDKIVFVPVGDAYEKPGLISAKHRLNMLKIAIKNCKNMEISDIEVQKGKLYTYQTLSFFKQQNPNDEIALIIGTDNLKELYWWYETEKLVSEFKILVLTREGLAAKDFPEYAENKNIVFVNFDFKMSASEIRDAAKEGNTEILQKSLNSEVIEYIKSNKLYGSGL